YVRDAGLIPLAAAVRKMAGESADHCRLTGRGYLRPGYAADLVIFATDEVRDTATFAASNQLPVGIDQGLVKGGGGGSEGTGTGRTGAGCCAGASRDSVKPTPVT